MADNDNGVSGLGWFLAGLGIGAVVGVLYAPKAGKETREDLVASAMDAKERAAVLAQQGRERAAQYAEQGRQQVNEYVDRGKEYYDRGRSQWSEFSGTRMLARSPAWSALSWIIGSCVPYQGRAGLQLRSSRAGCLCRSPV